VGPRNERGSFHRRNRAGHPAKLPPSVTVTVFVGNSSRRWAVTACWSTKPVRARPRVGVVCASHAARSSRALGERRLVDRLTCYAIEQSLKEVAGVGLARDVGADMGAQDFGANVRVDEPAVRRRDLVAIGRELTEPGPHCHHDVGIANSIQDRGW